MRVYKDKNGTVIKAGMVIKHDDGDVEKVFACGDDELGVNASNEAGGFYGECYPLHQFSMREWEVVKPTAKLIGADGNIFNLMGIASNALKKAGQQELAEEMYKKVNDEAEDYDHALRIIAEYVEVE